MLQQQHSFCIQNKLVADTEEVFGPAYSGQFVIRRPTLADKRAIALKDAAGMCAYGAVDPAMLGGGLKLFSYICIFVGHLSEAPLPEWFGLEKMFDGKDEDALMAVWTEVTAWLATFRSAATAGNSGVVSGEFTPVVPAEV